MSLRQRLLNGGRSYGPILLSDSPVVAELLAMVGYDHLIIDHEHSTTDIRNGQTMLMAIDAAASSTMKRTEPIVRVPNHDPAYIKKVLDSMRLPGGILVPMVEDAKSAEALVQATRYPPQKALDDSLGIQGTRGCAAPFIRASGWNFRTNYIQEAQQDLLVMVQVETVEGVNSIPEIAQVPGVDGIFLGPFDLSCSVGKTGQFDDDEVAGLISLAEEAVKQSPVFLAGFRPPTRTVQEMFDSGYSLVCSAVDLGLLRKSAMDDAAMGRAAAAAVSQENEV